MKIKTLTLPVKKNDEYGYELAHRLACEELIRIKDIEGQCRRCGARHLAAQKAVSLQYLNQTYFITYPNARISLKDKGEEVPLLDRILLLHYFTRAKGTPLSKIMISFKELPEGAGYFPTFYNRAIKPLVTHFGDKPYRLIDMAKLLGGHKADYGDVSVIVPALSRVPLTLVLWKGDAEFPPEGSIMFDRTISDYLPTEDIIFLCQSAALRLVKLLKSASEP